jgi:ABC-type sugar transport system substrate-binding protein
MRNEQNIIVRIGKGFWNMKEQGIIIPTIVYALLVQLVNPIFFTLNNINNLLRQSGFVFISGIGMTLVLIAAGIDITSGYQAALATYPNANVCGFGAAGAARAATEAGISPDNFFIMGIDDIQETLDGVRSGRIQATMSQNFYRMGYEAATHLYNFVTNGTKPARDVIDSSAIVIAMSNITTYKQDMRNPAAWQ